MEWVRFCASISIFFHVVMYWVRFAYSRASLIHHSFYYYYYFYILFLHVSCTIFFYAFWEAIVSVTFVCFLLFYIWAFTLSGFRYQLPTIQRFKGFGWFLSCHLHKKLCASHKDWVFGGVWPFLIHWMMLSYGINYHCIYVWVCMCVVPWSME